MNAGTFNTEYEYAIIRYIPDAERGEGVNVGLVIKSGKRQMVLWNDQFNPPYFLKPRTWRTKDMKKWRDFYKEELTVLFPDDEGASLRLSSDYWNSIRARCREGYVLGESSFVFNNDPGKFEAELPSLADRLFHQLVDKEGLKRTNPKNMVKSFIEKYRFWDRECFHYPVKAQFKLISGGLAINLPFYQKNGISRAIWPLNAQPSSDTPSQATIDRLGRIFVAKKCFQEMDMEAEYILLTSTTLPKDDINVKMVEAEKGKVFSIEDEEACKYFSQACAPKIPGLAPCD